MEYDYELFLGGVPNGFAFLGKEDRDYVQSFYNPQCQDRLKFLVQIRQLGGKKYCYYNYLLYEGVIDNKDRRGSFFGLTLRLDIYCKDIHSIYGLLDILYRQYVHGKLLVVNESGKLKYLKYTVPNFSGQGGLHKQMETAAGQLISAMIHPESFVSLNGYPQMGANYERVHLHDFNNAGLDALVRQYGGVAMSPYYDGRKIADLTQKHNAELQSQKQGYEKQIRDNNADYGNQIKNLNAQLDMSRKEKSKLETEFNSKKQTIQNLEQRVSDLEEEKKKLQQVENISTLVARIEKPIKELVRLEDEAAELREKTAKPLKQLASAMSELSKQEKPDKHKKGYADDEEGKQPGWRCPHWVKPLLGLVAFLLVLVLGCLGLQQCSSGDSSAGHSSSDSPDQITTDTTHVDTHDHNEHEPQDLSEDDEEPTATQAEATPTQSTQTSGQIKINIVGYSGEGALKKNRLYPVELKGANALGGKWKVEGANITKGDINSPKIEITPNDTIVKIAFTAADGTEIQRELKAE